MKESLHFFLRATEFVAVVAVAAACSCQLRRVSHAFLHSPTPCSSCGPCPKEFPGSHHRRARWNSFTIKPPLIFPGFHQFIA